MARFCPLFSGSKANCTYIGGAHGLLVDAGTSFARLKNAMEASNINLSSVGAVLITHSHTDHIGGLRVLLKKISVPVIASRETLEYLENHEILPVGAKTAEIGEEEIDICDMRVGFFATSHDALGSGGYCVTLPDGNKISVCTDLGIVTDSVRQAISGSSLVLLEANHDLKMLKNGPYPPELKMRIMSEHGHLSNLAAAAELPSLLKSGTTRFVLGHLSQHNNLPTLAHSAATAALLDIGAKRNSDYILEVAAPEKNKVIYL